MPTYVYETIPKDSTEEPIRYEIRHSITEDALTKHPETGEAIRRIISGGTLISSSKSGPSASKAKSSSGGRCCAKNSCCG